MITHLNTEKCYLMGLLIGGGILKSGGLQIVLPYKKWGDLKLNPQRGGNIAEDILKRIKPLWKLQYDIDVFYKIDSAWKIIFNNISRQLQEDLSDLNLSHSGEFRECANLEKLEHAFTNKEMIRSFISGLVDTVGSLAATHRRFTHDFQVVSLEFKGKNFALVSSVARLLLKMGCIPDQILWNHPNQHSGTDRYYRAWKKGFKIRVALDDYLLKGGFVFQAKKLSAEENKELQDQPNTVVGKETKIEGRTTLHIDEDSDWLPPYIRGLHFIHYTHLAELFGIGLSNGKIKSINDFKKYVCPFTILSKGDKDEINAIVEKEEYLRKTKYKFIGCDIDFLADIFKKDRNALLSGLAKSDGFPINQIMQGIAYIYAATTKSKIKGKRVLGNYNDLINENIDEIKKLKIKVGLPNRGTCLLIEGDFFSCLVGYVNDDFNEKLISKDGVRLRVRQPMFEECIILEKRK